MLWFTLFARAIGKRITKNIQASVKWMYSAKVKKRKSKSKRYKNHFHVQRIYTQLISSTASAKKKKTTKIKTKRLKLIQNCLFEYVWNNMEFINIRRKKKPTDRRFLGAALENNTKFNKRRLNSKLKMVLKWSVGFSCWFLFCICSVRLLAFSLSLSQSKCAHSRIHISCEFLKIAIRTIRIKHKTDKVYSTHFVVDSSEWSDALAIIYIWLGRCEIKVLGICEKSQAFFFGTRKCEWVKEWVCEGERESPKEKAKQEWDTIIRITTTTKKKCVHS